MVLKMYQMNVKMTFSNGKLDAEINMEQPEGFKQNCRKYLVYKLKKSLYILKQSERVWYECIYIFFVSKGFTRSHVNYSLYVLQTCHYIVIITIYVDDLIILASNVDMINELKFSLEHSFKMNDLGELYFFS